MTFSVITNAEFNSYNRVLNYFNYKFSQLLLDSDITDGQTFLYDLGEYLDESKYPVDKIRLNVFTGYSNRIDLVFFYNNEKIAWVEVTFEPYGLLKISNKLYHKKDFQIFHHIIEEYFDIHNQQIYDIWMDKCKIHTHKENAIKVNDCTNYSPNGTSVILKGSLEEVFEQYAKHNDALKYCNGEFWKFDDNNIDTLYRIFKMLYKGNYSLHIALKRGVIID